MFSVFICQSPEVRVFNPRSFSRVRPRSTQGQIPLRSLSTLP